MRSKCGLLATLVAASIGLAQSPASAPKPASVEGSVTNALTGEPLLRAHISLVGEIDGRHAKYGALTNAAGRFSITGIPPASYTVRAECAGFVPTATYPRESAIVIVLNAGDDKDDVKLNLMPTGAISGRVVSPEGEPVDAVTLSIAGPTWVPFNPMFEPRTDENGEFRISSLVPGEYRISASRQRQNLPPEFRTDGSVELDYVTTWYPGSPDKRSAGRVPVQAGGETRGIEIRLRAAPVVCISGKVTGQSGNSERTVIRLSNRITTRAQPDGTFRICRIDPGNYRVRASWRGRGETFASAPIPVTLGDSSVDHIDLQLLPPIDIAGHLEFEATDPPLKPRKLSLREVPGSYDIASAEIAEDGSFVLHGLLPDRYRVRLPRGTGYLRSMRLGETAIDGTILDLRAGATAGVTLRIVAAPATGEIAGTVSDEHGPVARASVMLLSSDGNEWPFFDGTESKGDGSYRFPLLPPDTYRVVSVNENESPDDCEDVSRRVELHDGDKLSIDLKRH